MSEDPELERLLRQALHDRAAQIMPAGDGLSRIRDRVQRRRYQAWLRPAVATAAAAAAAVAIIAVPSLFNDSHHQHAGSAASPRNPQATATPAPPTIATPELKVAPVAIAWPFSTVQQARNAPTPADPRAVATDMVRAFAGSGGEVQLALRTRVIRAGTKTQVEVSRADSGRSVCSVSLARIAKTYVVTAATSPDVRIGTAPAVDPSAGPVKVAGTVNPQKDATGIVKVDIRKPGQRSAASANQGYYNAAGVPDQAWDATVNPVAPWPVHAVVAAWTVDSDGLVVNFTAEPATTAGAEPTTTP